MVATRKCFKWTALAAAVLIAACAKPADPVVREVLKDAASGVPAPSLADTKTIAQAFIYGLPIVMNYAVMCQFAVDPNSGQYKAPFNKISNEARVFTYKDTAVICRT